MPFRCHDLRHAFASRFLQATGDIPALQAILGHRSIQMTMRYAHMVTGHLHQAMANFGNEKRHSGSGIDRHGRPENPASLEMEEGYGGGWI